MTNPEPHEYDLSRLFDAYTETHHRQAASPMEGIGSVAFPVRVSPELSIGTPHERSRVGCS